MTEHAVVIAGGGPAGMMLAAELALAKVDVAVVERRPDHELAGSRAGGFNARTIEVLDQRGVADRFLAEGQAHAGHAVRHDRAGHRATSRRGIRISLGIWQNQIERIMAAWLAELPVRIYYEREVTGFAQDDAGVDVELSDGESLRAQYLVGCDGGRSVIRKAAGIEFPGWDATRSNLIAEVEMTEEPPSGVRHDATGVHGLNRMEDGRTVPGRRDRAPDRAEQRAHPARPQRGADRRVRHRLRNPQPDVDLPVHRHDAAGRGLPRRDASCWPATRRTCTTRPAVRASASVCRTR